MIMKGQKISDRYQIIKAIGEGGMANVYLAYDTILDRNVAVKVLRGDLANDEKIENEEGIRLEELLQMAKRILQTTDEAMEKSMIETLISSEPFSFYADEIRSAFEEGKI